MATMMTVMECAAEHGVCRLTVYCWVRDSRIRSVRLGPRTVRIPREEIDRVSREGLQSAERP